MRKNLFSDKIRFVIFIAAVFAFQFNVSAQCGLSSFPEGSPAPPTSAWQSVNVGSGTYVDFATTVGNIYSFRYAAGSTSSNYFDMTVSSASSLIPYNNSLSPVLNPWTGGTCPPAPGRPSSTEYYASFTGTFRINTNTWNNISSTCLGHVPGQTSAVLQYKVCPVMPDPGIGNNVWNVEAFVGSDISIPQSNARYGYYVDNNVDFVTTAFWNNLSNPSTASTWVGCSEIPSDNINLRARRQGFPCGRYLISDNAHDDAIEIYLNGTLIHSSPGSGGAGVVGNPSGYVLSSTDVVEIRMTALCAADQVSVSLQPQTVPPVSGGTIGGVISGTNVCEGISVGTFTNDVPGSGGTTTFQGGGSITYEWEVSTDSGASYIQTGVTTPGWSSNNIVPAGGIYVFRRRAYDRCGNNDISNLIYVYGRAKPNGTITPVTQTICPGSSATLTLNFTSGASPFNVTYTDGFTPTSLNSIYTGQTFTVSPTISPTTYSYVSISDSFGCVRATPETFAGAANIILTPAISISGINVTPVSCNGGNNGAINITATGGQTSLEFSIDSGVTYQGSNTFAGLTAGTYYVFVRDAFGCIVPYGSATVVSEPTALTIALDSTDASCANVNDGTITVTAGGGTPPYSYSLNGGPSQPGNVFNNVYAGNYTVTLLDDNNCSVSGSISVNNSYIISVDTISTTDISCAGIADGSITAIVNGGIPPYSYSINGVTFQSSPTFNGLAGGTYIVIGRDSKGCTEFITVNIGQNAPLLLTLDSVVDVPCAGSTGGAIYVTTSGGNGGTTYLWSNGTTNEDLTGVAGGVYNLVATDSKGCTAVVGATVDQPLALFLNIAQFNDLRCNGDSSGAIDVTANGGIPPYSYLWSNGATTEDVVELLLGNYTVTVTDANGCTQTITQLINEPTPIVTSVTGTNVDCFGGANGTADLTVSGGTSPYTYLWSTFVTTQDVTGLSGGTHTVVVTDYNGCQESNTVTILEPAQLVVTTAPTSITCAGANDGAIDVTVAGGTPNYTYLWNFGQTTQDLTGLGDGTYILTVTDANGCTATVTETMVNPSAVNTSFVTTNPRCFGEANGAIDLIPSGGVPPYTYAWSNGQTTQDLDSLTNGIYIVNITDSKNCNVSASVTISDPLPLYTSGFIHHVTCNGYNDGFVDITAYGGTLPYTFTWSSGQSTEDIGNVSGGAYYVSVTDFKGCQVASLYIVKEPTVLSLAIVSTPPVCTGTKTGNVAVIPTGGTKPYEYLWNNFVTDSSQQGVAGGKYVVLVTDSAGCHAYDSVEIFDPAPIIITGTVTDALCNGTATGGVNVSVAGGTPTYTYNWSNGAGTEDLVNVSFGTYTITVTDTKLCTAAKAFNIQQPLAMFTNVSYYEPSCNSSNNGFVSVEVNGGVIPYTYNWSNGQTGATATNLFSGVYDLTVTDNKGCTATVTAVLGGPTAITLTTTATNSKCYNTSDGTVTATVNGGVPPYIYEVNGVIQVSNVFVGLAPGTYIVSARDANGCEATATFSIAAPNAITVDLVAPTPVILEGMSTQLFASATSSPATIIAYYWSPIDSGFDFSGCQDPDFCSNPFVSPRGTTVFTVAAMNSDSCLAYDTVTIYVEHEAHMFIPTAFSPNGDDLNDRFEFDILGATNIEISVFERWGSRVYYNANQENGIGIAGNGWDGTKDGKLLPYDTYVYQMKVTYFDGVVKDVSGTVTIMK